MADATKPDEPTPITTIAPGYKTTEFWVHIAAQIIAVMVAIGLLASDRADGIMKAIGAVVAAIGSVASAVAYGNNRTNLKSLE